MRVRALMSMAAVLVLVSGPVLAIDEGNLHIYGLEGRPISFLDHGKPNGMTVELTREVQQRIGSKAPISIVPWARALALATGEQSVLLLGVIPSPDRDRFLQYVGPIFDAHVNVYAVRQRAVALRQRDPKLHNLRAGARRGSIFASIAREGGYNLTNETNSNQSASTMLMLGRFDLWFEAEELAESALAAGGYRMEDVEVMLRLPPRPTYFAFSKATSPEVIEAWKQGLADLKHDGTYQRIYHKWLPAYSLPPLH